MAPWIRRLLHRPGTIDPRRFVPQLEPLDWRDLPASLLSGLHHLAIDLPVTPALINAAASTPVAPAGQPLSLAVRLLGAAESAGPAVDVGIGPLLPAAPLGADVRLDLGPIGVQVSAGQADTASTEPPPAVPLLPPVVLQVPVAVPVVDQPLGTILAPPPVTLRVSVPVNGGTTPPAGPSLPGGSPVTGNAQQAPAAPSPAPGPGISVGFPQSQSAPITPTPGAAVGEPGAQAVTGQPTASTPDDPRSATGAFSNTVVNPAPAADPAAPAAATEPSMPPATPVPAAVGSPALPPAVAGAVPPTDQPAGPGTVVADVRSPAMPQVDVVPAPTEDAPSEWPASVDPAEFFRRFLPFDPAAVAAGADELLAGIGVALPDGDGLLTPPEWWYPVAAVALYAAAQRRKVRRWIQNYNVADPSARGRTGLPPDA